MSQKSHTPATGGLPHTSPPPARSRSVPHTRSPAATLPPRPIRRPQHHAAAITADIPTNFAAPAPPAERKGSFWVQWTISPFTLTVSLRQPRARDPSATAALVDLPLNELRSQGFC